MNYTSINNAFDLNNNNYGRWTNDVANDYDSETDNNDNNKIVNVSDNEIVNVSDVIDKNIDVDKLLNDYNNTNNLLKLNITAINQLEIDKNEIFNYKSNIFSKHQDIMIKLYKKDNDDTTEINVINDYIIKYIDSIKIYIDKWHNNNYLIKKKNLEEIINKQEMQLTSYRKLFINTTTEIIKTEKINKNICPICFENEINMCAVPCGHTCCNDCIIQSIKYHNARVGKCLSCRNPINEYIKFYIQL